MALAQHVQTGTLLEREGELQALDSVLAAARDGEGAIVLVEGPAGIGKTRLLTAARETAGESGMHVLSARGSDLERQFQWGVVRQLLEPALASRSAAEREELLAGAAGLAAPLVSGVEESAAPEPDEGALLHGLYWLCANLSAEAPVALTIDDAHWCDLPSLRFSAYLSHRIEGLRIALIVATRPGEAPREEDLLARVASEPGATVLHPQPLSGAGVAGIIGARLGAEPDARFTTACHSATQGNPFMVEELVRAVREQGLAPDSSAAEAVEDLGPRSVARSIARRVRALAPGALDLARAVAVLGPAAELRRVAALARLEHEAAGRAADALVAAEVLVAGRPLEFIHPLARAAVYGDLPPAERGRLHAEAARLLSAESAPPERVASHLLSTEPSGDGWTVEVLGGAAHDALAQGAPTAAVAYLERALAEPPAAEQLAAVLLALGRAEHADGRMADADGHLVRARELSPDDDLRARVALEQARAATGGDWEAVGRVCLEALATSESSDSPVARALESELVVVALNIYSLRDAVRPVLRRRLQQLGENQLDDPALLAALGLMLASGRPPARQGAEVAQRGSDISLIETNSLIPGCVGNSLLFAGELERAAAYYGEMEEDSRRRGWKFGTAWASGFRARVSLQLGEVRRAEEEGRLGLESLEDALTDPGPSSRGYLTGHLSYVLIERGLLDEIEALLARHEIPAAPADSYWTSLLLGARGRLRLAQGRAEEALSDARASVPDHLRDWNPACLPWRSDAAHALASLGRKPEGRELAERELELARAFEVPHSVACALRAAARCQESADRAAALLEEAIATVEATPARLELSHAVVELGSVLRRAGKRRAAVAQLRRGLDLAHRGGATALAQRAHAELVTAGARPRRELISGVDALTAAERRVADLAAKGMTNREIAQALFVTARTVEGHLTHAYQKLTIGSRTELPEALAAHAKAH